MKLFEKHKFENGKKEIFVLGHKIFTYYSDKLKSVRRCCNIQKDHAKYLVREKNMRMPHPVGIVITEKAILGNNCTIYQNVTIGNKNGSPTLGNNVIIYANSVIIGKINIGDNAIIGAGSIVLKDIPANEIWAGNPARFIKKIND